MKARFFKSSMTEMTFYGLCAIYLVLVYLFLNHTSLYFTLDNEDGIIELSGALLLLATSVVLFICGWRGKRSIPKYQVLLFLGAALVFFVAAGEEISWGQHMTGHGTPQWLEQINDQNETNLHNINKKFFDRVLDRSILLFALLGTFLIFTGRERFFGFQTPETPLVLGFLLMPIFRDISRVSIDFWQIGFLVFPLFPIVAYMKRDKRVLMMCALFVLVTLVVSHYHYHYAHLWGNNRNFYHEVRETMFALLSFVYALQLLRDFRKKPVQ